MTRGSDAFCVCPKRIQPPYPMPTTSKGKGIECSTLLFSPTTLVNGLTSATLSVSCLTTLPIPMLEKSSWIIDSSIRILHIWGTCSTNSRHVAVWDPGTSAIAFVMQTYLPTAAAMSGCPLHFNNHLCDQHSCRCCAKIHYKYVKIRHAQGRSIRFFNTYSSFL